MAMSYEFLRIIVVNYFNHVLCIKIDENVTLSNIIKWVMIQLPQ
jgi:hypothetical protein